MIQPQVRGMLVNEVVLSTLLDPYLALRALAGYSGLSVRTLRDYLVDPMRPLPCYRVGGKILVRRSEFDAWIADFKAKPDLDAIVADALKGLCA